MVGLGRASIVVRGQKPGKCTFCYEPIVPGELYLILRQFKKAKKGQFFVTLHVGHPAPDCVSEYFHKSYARRSEKAVNGRPKGTNTITGKFDPVDLAIRDSKLQRRRYLLTKFRRLNDIEKLTTIWNEMVEINTWLEESGFDRQWKPQYSGQEADELDAKIKRVKSWSKRGS